MTDHMQLARAGEAMEDLRLTVKEHRDLGNINLRGFRALEEARKDLAEALEKLAGS